jgi:hypothetical protein
LKSVSNCGRDKGSGAIPQATHAPVEAGKHKILNQSGKIFDTYQFACFRNMPRSSRSTDEGTGQMNEKSDKSSMDPAASERMAQRRKAGEDTSRGWMNPVGPDPELYPDPVPEPQEPPASGTPPVASEPANVGSGTANVGSDSADVGSGTARPPKQG